jgi:hypothetical protein
MRIIQRPTIDFCEWMKKDLLLELWETRPTIKEKKLEDGTDGKEVVFEANNRPVIDKRMRGVSHYYI